MDEVEKSAFSFLCLRENWQYSVQTWERASQGSPTFGVIVGMLRIWVF